MAVTNPWEITYGIFVVGGTSDVYLLHGPYVLDKSFTSLRMVFDVVVVAASFDDLVTKSTTLEDSYAARDVDLTINLDKGDTENSWVYTSGATILNITGSVSKSGNPDVDRGFARAYTVTIEGELPASDDAGLRELEVTVDREASKQNVVTIRGIYAHGTGGASVQYQANRDIEDPGILSGIKAAATWELVDEVFTRDRRDYICNFSRQYVELLLDQEKGLRNTADIVDHRVVLTETVTQPGDSRPDVHRLRRVIGTYDCALDIDEVNLAQKGAMRTVFEEQVRGLVLTVFEDNFNPQVFTIEDQRVSYDETTKRMSVSITILYQKDTGAEVVEYAQSLAYQENRNLDYTPVHNQDEYSAEADPGWATRLRVWTRTVVVIGDELPKRRIGERPNVSGPAGDFDAISGERIEGGANVTQGTGWNILQNVSQVTPQWVGVPGIDRVEQIKITILNETVVERFHRRPGGTTRAIAAP